jgi:protein-S-isoprenylcysteine O-methyltransferase Ste14
MSPDARDELAPDRPFWVLIPPPVWLMGTLVVGLRLHRVWPRRWYPPGAHGVFQVVGFFAMGAAAALVVSASFLFLRHRTTISPGGRAGALIVDGPFRFTRNPMYLGMALLYLGVTAAMGSAWPLLLLPLPLWVIDRRIIPFEERTLDAIFGDTYRAYQRRVRRWI